MKKITIQDIAAEMGLSRNTVAKALNGGVVSPQTRQAVVQKAWQMGYAKLDEKLLAEVHTSFKRVNTGTILVLFNQWQSTFWNKVLAGISAAVNEEGYRMQLHVVDNSDVNGEGVLRLITDDVKGIIFLCVFPIEFVKGVSKSGIPMTFFNCPVNALEYIALGDVINTEGFYSMNKLTSHCIQQLGCQKLSYIGYAEGSRGVQARYLGYLSACNQNFINIDERLQFTRPSNNSCFNFSMVEEVINMIPYMPDAFICEDDDVAKNLALALLQKDPKLASEIVITGFNDIIEPDFFKKDIISVTVKMEELGKRLVKSVIDRVHEPEMDIAFMTLTTYPKV